MINRSRNIQPFPQSAIGDENPSRPPRPEETAAAEASRERQPVYCLTEDEWSRLEDLALSLHGVLAIIRYQGFDNSSGAPELLHLSYAALERLLGQVRRRCQIAPEPGDQA